MPPAPNSCRVQAPGEGHSPTPDLRPHGREAAAPGGLQEDWPRTAASTSL